MNTSVKINIDTRKAKKDGTFPIILRLSHNRKTSSISMGYSVKQTDWDLKNSKVKASYKGTESVTRINNYLRKTQSKYLDAIIELDDSGELDRLSLVQLKERILRKREPSSFFEYADQLILSMKSIGKHGNARVYQHTVNAVRNYTNSSTLSFKEINLEFLKKFELFYLSKGNSPNGISVYFRTIRAIYNKAIQDKIVERKFYPFEEFRIKTIPTAKRAISIDAIRKIKELTLDENHPCFHARNYFMASFYLMGISFIDLAYLKVSNLKEGRVHFIRTKTKQVFNIKVNSDLARILKIYLAGKKSRDFIFPIIQTSNESEQYKKVIDARKRYNKKLKLIAKMCNIEENLTSYVSRHSFASLAKNNDVPVTAISEMLGHSSIKTTQVYLDSLNSDKLDEFGARIADLI